ncbi:MBL fold metallo-hydrolase [Desulfovibrio sp. DV]|uniref:MBL fold metallo-hydrolase n=1 Tax=Desulfovibrio sp. DV TaxID=1844708 RepID=UPI00094B89CC|nr:MBL fold metallo-hydrolase [Desulfovibrio sp. DV]
MYIKTFTMQPFGVNSYLAWTDAGAAVVVDCGGEPKRLWHEIGVRGLRLAAILLTHLHPDHVVGVAELVGLSKAPVYASTADAMLAAQESYSAQGAMVPVPPFAYKAINPGRAAFLGEPCLVLPVPGHTPGHLVYFFPRSLAAFTGDTIFRGNVGRTDSSYGNADLLLDSIRERILILPDAVELFPGHGPSTTVGREKAESPFFASQ